MYLKINKHVVRDGVMHMWAVHSLRATFWGGLQSIALYCITIINKQYTHNVIIVIQKYLITVLYGNLLPLRKYIVLLVWHIVMGTGRPNDSKNVFLFGQYVNNFWRITKRRIQVFYFVTFHLLSSLKRLQIYTVYSFIYLFFFLSWYDMWEFLVSLFVCKTF